MSTQETAAGMPTPAEGADVPVTPHALVRRFTAWQRATHAVLAISVFGLVLTGMPLKYSMSFWAGPLMALFGGPDFAGTIHRVCAVLFFTSGAMHIIGVIAGALTRRNTPLFADDSILPKVVDLKQAVQNIKYLRGKAARPKFNKFNYFEKFDYLAEVWGLLVIGGSGLIMWFPVKASTVLPGWAVNAALIFHSYEALLAMGFLFTIHFINTHLRPDVFPVDRVIFSGAMPLHEIEERYGGWYTRIMADPQTYLIPGEENKARAMNIISGTFLIVGFSIFGLAMMSALAEVVGYLIKYVT
jgi:cytochrome b subunit of formate dehydrogenase